MWSRVGNLYWLAKAIVTLHPHRSVRSTVRHPRKSNLMLVIWAANSHETVTLGWMWRGLMRPVMLWANGKTIWNQRQIFLRTHTEEMSFNHFSRSLILLISLVEKVASLHKVYLSRQSKGMGFPLPGHSDSVCLKLLSNTLQTGVAMPGK